MALQFLLGCLIGGLICFSQWLVGRIIKFCFGTETDFGILNDGKNDIPLTDFFILSLSFGVLYLLSTMYNSNFIVAFLLSLFISYGFIFKPLFYTFRYRNRRNLLFEQYIFEKTKLKVTVIISPVKFINGYAFGALPFVRLIILSEQLLENLSERNVKAILLHEVGHLKKKHLLLLYLYNLLTAFIYYNLLVYFFSISSDFSVIENLFWIVIGAGIFGVLAYFIPVPLMKRFEYDADSFGAKEVGIEEYSQMLQNLDNITGGALTRSDFYHPSLQHRLSKLNRGNVR